MASGETSFTPGFHLNGRGGELVQSYNLLATFGLWNISRVEGNPDVARLTVHDHVPDPYHLEHRDPGLPLVVELRVAKSTQRYNARLLATEPVLVMEIERPRTTKGR